MERFFCSPITASTRYLSSPCRFSRITFTRYPANAIFKCMVRLLTTRNLLTLVIIFITVPSVFWALKDYREWGLDVDVSFETIPENVDLILNKIKYTKTRDGVPLWTLVADSATHSMDDDIIRVKSVRMVFFDPEMGDIVLTADQGELQPENRTVAVHSNVKVVSPPGNTMLTEYLEYKEAANILQTDKVVKISFGHFKVSGKGMQMDVVKRTLLLLTNVKALLGT